MTRRRFAVFHSFPGLAEQESAERVVIAARNLGIEAKAVLSHDEIAAFDPEFVLCLTHHEARPWRIPTYGVVMAPLSWLGEDAAGIARILSYDGHLTLSDSIRRWIGDLSAAIGKPPLVEAFFPSVYATPWAPPPKPPATAAYVGTNWDGWRSLQLFQALSQRGDVRFFGPAGQWSHVRPESYGGPLPFDGRSVLAAYATAGIGLGLDRPDFIPDDLPSNRIFEIAAAGAVGVMADLPFTIRHFGDAVLALDHAAPPKAVTWQIGRHMAWIRDNPQAAREMARHAHATFNRDFAIERLLPNLLRLHDRAKALGRGSVNADDMAAIEDFSRRWTAKPSMSAGTRMLDIASDSDEWLWPANSECAIDLYVTGEAATISLHDLQSGDMVWSAPVTARPSRGGLAHARVQLPNTEIDRRIKASLSGPADLVGLSVRLRFAVTEESLSHIAVQGRVWIYGSGAGGRKVADQLPLAPTGFIDDFRTDTLDGIPVAPLADFAPAMASDDAIILASQHWAGLWHRLADCAPQRIYVAHPIYGAVAQRLPHRSTGP